MAYSKQLAKKYALNRDKFRSSDNALKPFLKKSGVKGKVILDFGCGDGPESERFLLLKPKKIIGLDPSGEMIRLAKARKLKGATFLKSNSKTIPLGSEQFDLVYSRFVLHYIKNLKSQFKEISRVLKPKGYFIALFQCLTDHPKFINKSVPIILGAGNNSVKIVIFSKSLISIKNDLVSTGFKIVKLNEVKNTDSRIDANYKNKYNFKNKTYALFAQKNN